MKSSCDVLEADGYHGMSHKIDGCIDMHREKQIPAVFPETMLVLSFPMSHAIHGDATFISKIYGTHQPTNQYPLQGTHVVLSGHDLHSYGKWPSK